SLRDYQYRWQLDWQHTQHYVEGRLLALCYPELLESMVMRVTAQAEANSDDMVFAIRILGVLAQAGRKAAETTLAKLSSGDNPIFVSEALEQLGAYDTSGLQSSLYATQCRKSIIEAFSYGPYTADQGVTKVVQEVLAD